MGRGEGYQSLGHYGIRLQRSGEGSNGKASRRETSISRKKTKVGGERGQRGNPLSSAVYLRKGVQRGAEGNGLREKGFTILSSSLEGKVQHHGERRKEKALTKGEKLSIYLKREHAENLT